MAAKKQTKTTKSKQASARKRVVATVTDKGRVYVTATFNNTLVTITNEKGDTLSWSSSGARGFKGTRRSTAYAASLAVEDAVKRATERGVKSVDIFIKGPGSGRDSALRAVKAGGLSILSISDITPIPHNGPRAKKKRRM